MDVGIAYSIFTTRARGIHSSVTYLLFQIMETTTSITFLIHFSDGIAAHGWCGIVIVYGIAGIGFGKGSNGNKLLVLHPR